MTKKSGFTILEVIIAGMLIVILGVGILGLQQILTTSQLGSLRSFQSVSGATQAVSEAARELRTARRGEDGSFTFEYAGDQEIVFFADTDANGTTEKIRYYVEGNLFKKSVIEASGTPAQYLPENETIKIITEHLRNNSEPIFTYYSATNEPLPTPADLDSIKMVKIYIRVNPIANPQTDYILQSQVQIRTLREDV